MTSFIIFASLILAIGIMGVVAVLISSNKNTPKLIPFLRNKPCILNDSDAATLLNEGQWKEHEVGSVCFYKKALPGGKKSADNDLILGATIGYIASETLNDD